MKNRKIELETIVTGCLVQSREARDDDFVLVNMVYDRINATTGSKSFDYVMRNHVFLGLPSFESITRARRKVQAARRDLQGSKQMKAIRKQEEKAFYNYATDTWYEMDELPF